MDKAEVEALIRLIDDEDQNIYEHVKSKLLELGSEVFEELQEHSMRAESELQHQRLKEIIGQIHLENLKVDFREWIEGSPDDLRFGFYLVSKYQYPELSIDPIISYIDKMKLDIWLRLNYKFSPLDNVRIINEVFFGKYRFHGDQKDQQAPENSYLNLVIENRKGNPISLSILYSIIAQRLYLPIFGVNLPQHFILAYKDDSHLKEKDGFNTDGTIPYDIPGEILFYVNAYNGGAIFSKFNIDRFLVQSSLPNDEKYFEPCSNPQIILRVIRNLISSYDKPDQVQRKSELKELHDYIAGIIAGS